MNMDDIFLFGSRSKLDFFYADMLNECKDFDYSVEANSLLEVQMLLLNNLTDWHMVDNSEYLDDITIAVIEKNNIQISFKKDLEAFKNIWNSIPCGFYWKYINKRSDHYLGKEGVREYINSLYYSYQTGRDNR